MSLSIPVLNSVVPVLQAVLAVPLPVLNLDPPQPVAPNDKKYVIIHTVDIPKEDMKNFKSFGSVIVYNYNVEGNIPVSNLSAFDYLFLDLRDHKSRLYYDSNDLTNYNVVLYISVIEQYDAYIESLEANNILVDFPEKLHYKASYDLALLQKPTNAPSNGCISCVNFGYSFFRSSRIK